MALDLALGALPRLAPGASVWVGFSGGLDSTVLLHRLAQTPLVLKAVHVNHHLQAASGRWADHCREACARWKVPIYVVDVAIDPRDPDGPEGAARRERYGAFRSLMKAGDWLATAHHLDDQAETVLLRLLRGSGPAGLAAMRERGEFAPGHLWRPLLRRSRPELRAYAELHQLHWIEDPHNLDPRFSRTFVRHELFPRIQQRWPQALEMIARSAAHCAEAAQLLAEMAAADLARLGGGKESLPVRGLLAAPAARRANVLRHWALARGHEVPPFEAIQRLEADVLRARPDAAPVLGWGATELRRFRDRLHLMPRLAPPPGERALEWDGRRPLELPDGCGRLEVASPARVPLDLRVRFARGGERIKPAGSRLTRTLRNLFQEEGVPPWVRERTPLIECDGELVAVAHHWPTTRFRSLCRRHGLRYRWRARIAGAESLTGGAGTVPG